MAERTSNFFEEQAAGAYKPTEVDAKWQRHWSENNTFAVGNPGDRGFDASKPKCYVLDMFPYPSGSGLHVGHPLGYCATDIYCRYKRMKGFNVLHPMGYDAFGLPAEQHAIETGVHPAITTKQNIETYRRQLKMLGLSYDWDREVATCDASYYRWTQWIFLELFNSWYDQAFDWQDENGQPYKGRARPIVELVAELEAGNLGLDAAGKVVRGPSDAPPRAWTDLNEREQRQVVNDQRLAYIAEVDVNWCPAMGTVLSNEEVTANGLSERGNHPVFRRPLRQWMMRITKFADRLLSDLDKLNWPEPIKLMQRNWIGRSTGAEVDFVLVSGGPDAPVVDDVEGWQKERAEAGFLAKPEAFTIRVYTTRPDTLFGATYMVIAPEHPLVEKITTDQHRQAVEAYVKQSRHKSELDRTADTKEKTGEFTGAYALNPVTGEKIPVWVADYVMMSYGTGAIMAVPAGDTRDFEFAQLFDLPISAVVMPGDDWLGQSQLRPTTLADLKLESKEEWEQLRCAYRQAPAEFAEAFTGHGIAINSGQFDGTPTAEFKTKITAWLVDRGIGKAAVNYKLRDWIFSRQKYWGEPFPVLHGEDGLIEGMDGHDLPLELPEMDDFKPTPSEGDSEVLPEPPLGRAKAWVQVEEDGQQFRRDTNTMPQWAGSCWYYLRFCDPTNPSEGWNMMAEDYWMPVDLYVGGAEHAVLHLLYARFWHKALFDLGHVSGIEPFKKLINQGMIQAFAYKDKRGATIAVDKAEEIEEGKFRHIETKEPLEQVIAKISKSLKNVVTPDDIVAEFGADAFRLYEMFMGPIEASKPWNTRDVPGVFRLLNRIWRLVIDEETAELSSALTDDQPDDDLNRILHKTIQKVGHDIEAFKFNTAIGQMFDFVNTLTRQEKRPRSAIEPFVLLVAPFAPHLAEELWQKLGHTESLAYAPWPEYEEALTKENQIEVPVQINGKIRSRITVAADADEAAVEAVARADTKIAAAIEGKTIRKIIVIKGRLVNMVCG